MPVQQVVVLYGDSLLMDTIEASLGQRPDLGVLRIPSSLNDATERIQSLGPDLVIFDLDDPHSNFAIPFLRRKPGVPLLGLDLTSSRVLAFSSQQYTTLTARDLAHVIETQAEPAEYRNGATVSTLVAAAVE
jgi:chemotaxis response regulator CheB